MTLHDNWNRDRFFVDKGVLYHFPGRLSSLLIIYVTWLGFCQMNNKNQQDFTKIDNWPTQFLWQLKPDVIDLSKYFIYVCQLSWRVYVGLI